MRKNIFKFVNGSAHIDYDLTNKPTTEATIANLANIFNLEVSENTLQEIENLLSEKVFGFNEDLTRASLLKLTEENTIGGSTFIIQDTIAEPFVHLRVVAMSAEAESQTGIARNPIFEEFGHIVVELLALGLGVHGNDCAANA